MIFGWQNYKANSKKPLVLYGAGVVGTHFLEKNGLKPVFIIDKNAETIGNINKIPLKTLEQSSQYLRETETDIIISTINPQFITEVLISLKQLSLHRKSAVYVYHKYDLKTKTIKAKPIEVIINGSNTYDGSLFPPFNYKAKKILPSDLLNHFPNMKNSRNIDEMFDILEFALWNFKWNKNRDEQLWIVKEAYSAYIQPILLKNQKLTDKYQSRIKILKDYFDYILQGDFSKAKASKKMLKANADFKISVIVPMYNNEFSLKKTFNSIVTQSYQHSKIEVLFIDNGSTDNSINRIKKLIDGYKGEISFKVLILSGQDRWHARNVGVEKAKGKYVIFLDAGNRFTKNALLTLANLAKVYGADIVQGEFPAMEKTIFPEYTTNSFWLYVHFISESMSSKLIRKSFIQDYNYWWEKQLDMEALEWCKNIITIGRLATYFPIKMAFSKIKCEISDIKTKKLYPLCNTVEQAKFYLKICMRLLHLVGNSVTLNFFKYKFTNILPFVEYALDKALKIIPKTENLKNISNAVAYLKKCEYITEDIYLRTIKQLFKNITAVQNKHVFGEFKNAFAGKTVVLVAGGPTVADFIPIKNAIYMGVNNTLAGVSELKKFEHIKFDFLFVSHRLSVVNFKQTKNKLHKNAVIFCSDVGLYTDLFPTAKLRGIDTRENFIHIDTKDRQRLLQDEKEQAKKIEKFSFDITNAPPFASYTIATFAFQFSLFSGAKKIYLVGCDCYCKEGYVHFYRCHKAEKISNNIAGMHSNYIFNNMILSWKFFKKVAEKYCPNTQIISVNPVGLKGLFHKDIYS